MKLKGAIKLASEHKVSNSAMNKTHKWNKQKHTRTLNVSTGTTTLSVNNTTSSPAPSTTTSFKQVHNSSHSATISTLNNDICPYQATITTTAVNGCKQKESKNNSVIVKSEAQTEDILDLSPNKSSPVSFAFNKLKDVTVICNNISKDNNSSSKTVRIN